MTDQLLKKIQIKNKNKMRTLKDQILETYFHLLQLLGEKPL